MDIAQLLEFKSNQTKLSDDLRKADPQLFQLGFCRIVQRDKQPLVFPVSMKEDLEKICPNMLVYRNNIYVPPNNSIYSDVKLRHSRNYLPLPCLFKPRNI